MVVVLLLLRRKHLILHVWIQHCLVPHFGGIQNAHDIPFVFWLHVSLVFFDDVGVWVHWVLDFSGLYSQDLLYDQGGLKK